MNNKTIGIIGALGVAGLLFVVYLASVFGFRGDCVRAEAGIKAQYEQNQNNYDNMWKRFKEMAQVPSMRVADVEKVYRATMEGRYGADGSKAMFQMIREVNPNIDASLYANLQRAIEAGRTSFAADQSQLIDKKRQYEVILNGNRAMLVGMWFSFPTIDLAKYGIVTSDSTQEAFSTKRAEEIKLR